MKKLLWALSVVTFALLIPVPSVAQQPQPKSTTAQATYDDIQKTLGLVPAFMKTAPPELIPGLWSEFKAVELSPSTQIPVKYKELIGLAVAAQIPCKYCIYFHTQAAKAAGATDAQVKEAVAEAALTRHWSTFLNGMAYDEGQFNRELQKMGQFQKSQMKGTGGSGEQMQKPPSEVTSADQAYKEMNKTMGLTPSFMKEFPKEGVAGAWQSLRDFEFAETAIPSKYKNLISLGVSAQIPCKYCVAFDTQGAKQAGATQQEIAEAVAQASVTRTWSTVLNGNELDEKQFRAETDQILSKAKGQQPPKGTGGSGKDDKLPR